MKIVSSAVCETGQKRNINQDSIYSYHSENWGMFAVADGMGGHEKGEYASNEVTHALQMWVQEHPHLEEVDTPDIVRMLKQILDEVNNKIREVTSVGKICGCTIVRMVLVRRECILITAGDSRCYEIQQENRCVQLVQLSVDDVVGGEGSQKNHLTNALGVKIPFTCRRRVLPFKGIHLFLICSDGIYKYCRKEQINRIVGNMTEITVDKTLAELQKCVEANGAGDNYSAILVWAEND